ncbi:hypothetical protein MKX08_004942 [Trichoderma sp. CBMAI-0020]|nr:hypothetical protein MKX08_004942 [Trichoderma sp. CBMAI-0020]
MAPQEKKWDDAAERDLCISMIYCNTESGKVRQNWPRIEEVMKGLGYAFTKDAMSQHYSKTIMKEFKARHPDITATSLTETPSPANARKTKAAAAKADGAASTPSKKRAKKSAATVPKDEDGDDDTELDATPSKRAKKEDKATPTKKEEKVTPVKGEEEAADAITETADDEKERAFQA